MLKRYRLARPIHFEASSSADGVECAVPLPRSGGSLQITGDVVRILSYLAAPRTLEQVFQKFGVSDAPTRTAIEEIIDTLVQEELISTGARRPKAARSAFLTGAHGAGGTLLRWLLDAHPDFSCPPVHDLVKPFEVYVDRLTHWWYGTPLHELGFKRAPALKSIGGLIDDLYLGEAQQKNKVAWISAARAHDQHLLLLQQLFGRELMLIVAVRHPLDQIHSLVERFTASGWQGDERVHGYLRDHALPQLAFAHYWRDLYSRLGEFQRAQPERVLVARYEQVIDAPDATLSALFERLGSSWRPELLRSAFEYPHVSGFPGRESRAFESASRLKAGARGAWRRWPGDLADQVWRVVRDEATRWGYRSVEPADRPTRRGPRAPLTSRSA
jgi:hypothetical protein